jgi:hypothetical protein
MPLATIENVTKGFSIFGKGQRKIKRIEIEKTKIKDPKYYIKPKVQLIKHSL